jgi:uncharacterized protein YaeQ
MALNATVFSFDIELADSDRAVYRTLALRVAQHPSETEDSVLARVLAYCVEYTEGIGFSRGLSDADEPALAVRDLTGALQAWIDVGLPAPARLHRASKLAPRVAVYTHKDPALLLRALAGERIHRADALELYAFERPMLESLVHGLHRRMSWAVNIAGGHLYVDQGGTTLDGSLRRLALTPAH